eukprot:scaffold265292_cov39-Prasinocladus_malaysianus.AAC.2
METPVRYGQACRYGHTKDVMIMQTVNHQSSPAATRAGMSWPRPEIVAQQPVLSPITASRRVVKVRACPLLKEIRAEGIVEPADVVATCPPEIASRMAEWSIEAVGR